MAAEESGLAWRCMRVGGGRRSVHLLVQETPHQALELDDAIVKRSKAGPAAQLWPRSHRAWGNIRIGAG